MAGSGSGRKGIESGPGPGAYPWPMQIPLTRRTLLAGGLGLAPSLHAQTRAWRVCIFNTVVLPYITQDPERPGLLEQALVEAGREVGLQVELLRYPIERCRLLARVGELEVMLASAVPANLAALQFPMHDGQPDSRLAVTRNRLLLIQRGDSAWSWDGRALSGRPRVGTRRGAQVGLSELQALGLEVDATSLDSPHLLRRLLAGRFDLALLGSSEFQTLQAQQPEFATLQALGPPFMTTDFYAALAPRPELLAPAQAWWQALARLRRQNPDWP